MTEGSRFDVAVVGAGISGLRIASLLSVAGLDVRVLEATRRVGGRIRTIRSPFADGQYVEAGAHTLRSYHPRALALVAELGLPLEDAGRPPGDFVVHVAGHRLRIDPRSKTTWPTSLDLSHEERTAGPTQLWMRAATPVLRAMAEGTLSDRHYDDISLSTFMAQRGASPDALRILRLGVIDAFGEGIDSLSAQFALATSEPPDHEPSTFTIEGGMDRLPRALARRLRGRIEYGVPVVGLEVRPTHVVIGIGSGQGRRTLRADHVVLAMPVPVIRRLTFRPSLDPPLRAALDGLPTTSATRLAFQFPRKPIREAGLAGVALTDLPVQTILNRTYGQEGDHEILEIGLTGSSARAVAQMREADRIAFGLRYLAICFPELVELIGVPPSAAVTFSWDRRKRFRGGYGYFAPNQMTDLAGWLRRPAGRVHFAGDHTSDRPGWVEGALESADRVVGQILHAI